jgi:hypothetical protein
MPFQPGQSGNPTGRPKKDKQQLLVEVLAREHTESALQTLVQIMQDTEARDTARVTAAVAVLNRGWGMPKQDVNLSGQVDVTRLDDHELAETFKAELAGWLVGKFPRSGEATH